MSRLRVIDWAGLRSRAPQDWPWQLRLLSCLLAAMLAGGLAWLLLLQPLEQQRQEALQQQASVRQQQALLQQQLQRQPELVRIRQQLAGLQEQLQRELPQDWQEPVWQARLQFAVPGLQVRRFKPMKPKRLEGGLMEQPVELECSGSFAAMQALAVVLAQLEPVTLVRRWQLTAETRKGKSVTGELRLKARIVGYRLANAQEQAQGKRGKGRRSQGEAA